MSIRAAISRQMHDGTCPGAGSLGECAAVWLRGSHSNTAFYAAAVYLWPAAAALKFADVARWFQDATGCEADDVIVHVIVHDPYNDTLEGFCHDGARALDVSFSLSLARAAELGMELPTEPPGPELSPRLSAAELMGARDAAPHITPQQIEEVATMPVDQMQVRLISALALVAPIATAKAQAAPAPLDYRQMLEDGFAAWQEFNAPQQYESRAHYLADHVFEFTTYDDELAKELGAKALEVCRAISERKTFEYVADAANHRWFIVMSNMPFFARRLNWGTSVRGAWWDTSYPNATELDTTALWLNGHQVTETLELTTDEWCKFIDALLAFAATP